jgi:hypothetical protein
MNLNKTVFLLLTVTLLIVGQSVVQQPPPCPIEFQKVDPNSMPWTAGLLGPDKDPWDHYLRIEYKNISGKAIIATKFGVAFVDALADARESVYSYTSDEIVQPGKIAKPYWGDGAYFNQYGWRMSAIAWLEKVRFADNTFFVDDGSHSCAFPHPLHTVPTQSASAGPSLSRATVAAFEEAAKNSEAAAATLAKRWLRVGSTRDRRPDTKGASIEVRNPNDPSAGGSGNRREQIRCFTASIYTLEAR